MKKTLLLSILLLFFTSGSFQLYAQINSFRIPNPKIDDPDMWKIIRIKNNSLENEKELLKKTKAELKKNEEKENLINKESDPKIKEEQTNRLAKQIKYLKDKRNSLESSITVLEQSLGTVKTEIVWRNKTKKVYKTENTQDYNSCFIEMESKKEKLGEKNEEAWKNSVNTSISKTERDIRKEIIRKEIETLKSQFKSEKRKGDGFMAEYWKEELQIDTKHFFDFNVDRASAFYDLLYDDDGNTIRGLTTGGVNLGSKTGSVYVELVSGNLGLVRASFGSLVSSSSKENSDTLAVKHDEAYQRLITYGGNTVLNFEYPLIYIHSFDNRSNFIARAVSRFAGDIPAFGTNTDKFAGSTSLGIDIYGDADTTNNDLRFFANFNLSGIWGTDIYQQNLGVTNRAFVVGQLSCGIVFLKNYKISMSLIALSDQEILQKGNVVYGGQVIR